ncbi:cysteine desulfurase-like protein [Demetria terragena]|uniref:cysteine desulfurase-like protein n=1 Tax=Demetria terragena TaxID=63959 RepID=UPI000375112B|nr:cysteine desulfurase-like protein [Demetria terragena]
MTIDVPSVRAQFPALAHGGAFFDGPGGTQVPQSVAEAVSTTLTGPISNRGPLTPASRRADEVTMSARGAMADLTGVPSEAVVFGRSMTALTYDVARTMAKDWGPGDEVVVSRLDHDGNIRPWVDAARAVGAMVRWAEFDTDTGELTTSSIEEVLSARTRLVAFTGASNLIGTRPDVSAITRVVREAGALSYVDGVHLTPHAFVDVAAMGADLYAFSPYKFCGPHLGVLVGRTEVLEELRPDKLLPSANQVPERFELGTLPYELLAGATAAVDFLAGLAGPWSGQRRKALSLSLAALDDAEDTLREQAEDGLAQVEGLRLWGRAAQRTPTLLFTVEGVESARIAERLAAEGVYAPAGSFYALEASRALGLGDSGGVRVGMAPYTSGDEVARLVDGVRRAVQIERN